MFLYALSRKDERLTLDAVTAITKGGKAVQGLFGMLEGLIAVTPAFVECKSNEGQVGVGLSRLHREAGLCAG